MIRFVTCLFLLAAAALAKPPQIEGFVRMDEFNRRLRTRFQELKEAEEFAQKPFPEKLLIRWNEGATSFESVRKLTGEVVLKEIFEWDELIGEKPSEAADRVAKSLPDVLKTKYGEATRLSTAFRRDRYKTARVLVDQLVKPPLHVRELAIKCLQMTYNGNRRGYVETDSSKKRLRRQKEWLDYIKRRLK
ncbi:MAG: hypothetical protein ACYTGZ_15810 [Planctomycetota bacterium]